MSTKYISNKFLNWLLNGEILPQMTNLRLGLLSVMPDEDGLGYAEPSATSYQRANVVPADFANATEGSVSNVRAINFPGAVETWGTILGVALFESTGTLLWAGTLAEPIEVVELSQPVIEIGGITFNIGPASEQEPCPDLEVADGYWLDNELTQVPDGYWQDGENLGEIEIEYANPLFMFSPIDGRYPAGDYPFAAVEMETVILPYSFSFEP
jgi:hypothetical protein